MIFTKLRGRSDGKVEVIPSGTPSSVLVTVFDDDRSEKYEKMIRDNREEYALRHGGSRREMKL